MDFVDRARGVVFGQAVGDALGLATEFMTPAQVRSYYPEGVRDYHQCVQDAHRSQWKPGEWTDDTDQFLCLLDSLLETEKLEPSDQARRLLDWSKSGRGLGMLMRQVLWHPLFPERPQIVAQAAWEASGREAAPNGAVMRTACLALWNCPQATEVAAQARQSCLLTHWDPRCVGSCVGICLAIRALLLGRGSEDAWEAGREASRLDPRCQDYLNRAADLSALELGGPEGIGYTLKAFGAGMWAARIPDTFEEGLTALVMEGGDADTNGAVAGAVMGARFGYSQIPPRWTQGLLRASELETRVKRYLEIAEARGWVR